MSQQMTLPILFCKDAKTQATFGETGPQPRFFLDSDSFKVLVVGLEAGQQIPIHPESTAMYHFLEGNGTMTVDAQEFAVEPGAVVIALAGAKRGIKADSRLVFLAAKAG